MKRLIDLSAATLFLLLVSNWALPGFAESYPIVDTGQQRCYNNSREITYPKPGSAFFGQDAQYQGHRPEYRDNGDGTVTDLATGLMWQKDPGDKKTYAQAVADASKCRLGGYNDWRLPTIKELYSLILFSGSDPDPHATNRPQLHPFIDTDSFKFSFGDEAKNERIIDSQYATSTKYVGKTMGGNETMFGVNFADGRIKGYPVGRARGPRGEKKYYVMYVRGNSEYGKNQFHDNGDGTVTDRATGLTWMQVDSGHLHAGKKKDGRLNWSEALAWAERLEHAGHSDWRLPNAKELQSIVDYTRSPSTSKSAAIDPVLKVTAINNEGEKTDYPCYWSSTTHKRLGGGAAAAYVAFGRSLGWMQFPGESRQLMDVHGAGSQRSDPKAGNPSQFPYGRGPQGDVIRIYNFARAVRGGEAEEKTSGPKLEPIRPQQAGPRRGMGQGRGMQQGQGMGRGRGMQQGQGMGRGSGMQQGQGMGRRPGMQQGQGQGRRPSFVQRLDRDRDGKVSRQEFDGPANHFDHLDRNGDGYLSEAEGPQGPPAGQRPGSRGGRRGGF